MSEFGIIDKYFKPLGCIDKELRVGIGDDAAVLSVPLGYQLAVSTDTLVGGLHFLSHWSSFDIARRALAVNISDMAAMGARAKWVSIGLTMPSANSSWLKDFSQGLKAQLNAHEMKLIGGDLTCGPLAITVTIQGLLPNGYCLGRGQAQVGDTIYVTGSLGAPRLAVENLTDNCLSAEDFKHVFDKLINPEPRTAHGRHLLALANAAIDVSDGLAQDLSHICRASGVGACLQLDTLPIDEVVRRYKKDLAVDFALNGGDEYELCFSVSEKNKKKVERILIENRLAFHAIGNIEPMLGLRGIQQGRRFDIEAQGFQHF